MLRYHYSLGGSRTSSMDQADDGTVKFTITTDQTQVYFDAPGYVSAELDLSNRDPSVVIDVKLSLAKKR